jgi:hypothetical protein
MAGFEWREYDARKIYNGYCVINASRDLSTILLGR